VPTDTARFDRSSTTTITFSKGSAATVNNIEFAQDAPAYTFEFGSSDTGPALTIAGQGITNNSSRPQSFVVKAAGAGHTDARLAFTNSATAGGPDIYYYAGPETREGYGGGVIGFSDASTAGSASFTVRTGAARPPGQSTVGGEISFNDSSSAGTARFAIHGTLGSDGDTFGNVAFHDNSSADYGRFTNFGGAVSGGDGGNTQFFDTSTAAQGVYDNRGGTHDKANGGDVAFDGSANGGRGQFYNHAAQVTGAFGGVTSFNNNPSEVSQGASAGHGFYHNYGASESGQGGGGHTEFTAKHGSPTAGNGTFINYGSAIEGPSSAGHTIFSITTPTDYHPTAGNGVFWNHPAVGADGSAGFTEFAVYADDDNADAATSGGDVPTAGDGTFHNLGGQGRGVAGGYTVFKNTTSAGNAQLIAYGGASGGEGGRVMFHDDSSGASARVKLYGNGVLDLRHHTGELTIGSLELTNGLIYTQLGTKLTSLTVSENLALNSASATFSFWKGHRFKFNTPYTILAAANLSSFTAAQFSGTSVDDVQPTFTIVGNKLQVSFNKNP
jgi:hypothetical protein